jgi:hypothetical protein
MRLAAAITLAVLTALSTPSFAQSTAIPPAKPGKQIDSLWNGALIGAGVGAATAWIFTRANCGPRGYDNECSAIAGIAGTIVFVPSGAIAGAIIDRLINKTLPPGTTAHTTIAPLVADSGGRRRMGVAFNLKLKF